MEVDQKGWIAKATSFDSSGKINIPDQSAASYSLPGALGENIAIISVTSTNGLANGLFLVSARPSGPGISKLAPTTADNPYIETRTGVLTGTTGTNQRLTVSAATDNRVYFENRTGGPIDIKVTVFGALVGP